MGFKAPLAYSSSFHFICRKDGMEWKYMMYEGEDSNKIDLLYAQHTTERNGVKVIIPVKYSDRSEFLNKIREQLAYFESVFFNTGNVNNDFTIIRAEHYQTSPLVSVSAMHICLDNIYYPIDFVKLGIATMQIPLALRFGLSDGIFPTPNRESIRYTQEAKQIILDKIAKVAEVIVEMYNESILDTHDIQKIFKYYGSAEREVIINGKTFNILPFLKYAKTQLNTPKLIGVELLDLKQLSNSKNDLLSEYEIGYTIRNRKMSEIKSKDSKTVSVYSLDDTYFYSYSEAIGGRKREYLKELCNYNQYYLCKKINDYKLGFISRRSTSGTVYKFSYYHILELGKHPKAEWRQRIKEFQFIQEMFVAKFKNIDDIVVPQSWIDGRKRDKALFLSAGSGRRIKLTGEIFGKTAVPLERYVSGQNSKFIADTYKLEDVPRFKGLTIYDSYDNQSNLDKLYYISRTRNRTSKIRCLSFSNRELKTVETLDIHNLISFTTFMKGDNAPFKRLITAYLINLLIEDYSNVFGKRKHLLTISKPFLEKLDMLVKYKDKYFQYGDSDIYKAMLTVANQHLLFDMSIYTDYLDMRDVLKKLTFLEPVMKTMTSYNVDPMIPVLVDLFKYYKHRIDYQNYKVPLNEMIDFGSLLLTDETIEELVTSI